MIQMVHLISLQVPKNDLKLAKEYGAVGHVLARLMDKDGNEVTFPNHYPIAAPLEALREADWSIGIVASKKKGFGYTCCH